VRNAECGVRARTANPNPNREPENEPPHRRTAAPGTAPRSVQFARSAQYVMRTPARKERGALQPFGTPKFGPDCGVKPVAIP